MKQLKNNVMKKLNAKQIEILGKLLVRQLRGNTIFLGNRYGYNDNQLYIGNVVYDREDKKNYFKDTYKVENRITGKSISRLGVFEYLPYTLHQGYSPLFLNVEKLKINFSNALDVVKFAYENL